MNSQVFADHNKHAERINLFKQYGYDTQSERAFILAAAQPLAGSILELGTGAGNMTIALAQAGLRFTSIDRDAEAQMRAQSNLKYLRLQDQVTFEIDNLEKLTFTDGSFDKIICVNTIHHLDEPYKVMDEMVRVLATRGKIVLSDFTQAGLEIVNKVHADEGRSHSVSNVGIDSLGEYLVSKNFAIKKVSSTFQDVVIAFRLN
jgi:ubiquinone/menaquinone biosynthesis C-methylase UbiE